MASYSDYGIELNSNKTHGEVDCVCPKCSHDRKKVNVKCLRVNVDKKTWLCQHCGFTGGLPKESGYVPPTPKTYKKPIWKNNLEIGDKLVKWFEKERKISQKTLKTLKITEGVTYMPQIEKEINCIQFNYFRDGELVNIKSRDGAKRFKLESGAELIFYNLDSLINAKEAWIVEGEIETLTLQECGIIREGVAGLSVPNGANLNKNNLQYIDNCIDLFDTIEKIHIATDDDPAGRKLREELADRFGKDRCDYIDYKGKKDLNEVLVAGDIQAVIDCCAEKKEFPLEGIFKVSDYLNDIEDMYLHGIDNGIRAGMGKFDDHLRFVKGWFSVVGGIPNSGKALSLDTDIPTVNGWKKMGDIQIFDQLFDENGKICYVTNVTDVMYNRTCYNVVFNDGTSVIADADHLWLTDTWESRRSASNKRNRDKRNKGKIIDKTYSTDQTHKMRFATVKTTDEIRKTITTKNDNRYNHSIPLTKPIEGVRIPLLIPPYTLGAWLGDGSSYKAEIHGADKEILDNIAKDGFKIVKHSAKYAYGINEGLLGKLKKLNLLENKHIPPIYLRASVKQRVALLQGLMDTDGTADKNGICEFCNINKSLAHQVYELITSLGMKATIKESDAKLYGRIISKKYRIQFTPQIDVFKLKRKSKRLTIKTKTKTRSNVRFIVKCEPIDSVPVKCIEVDSPSHLYLCTRSFIPTHNTAFLDNLLVKLMVNHGWKNAYYSPENKPTKLHFSKLARILIGKNWFGKNRITKPELQTAMEFFEDKVFFVEPERNFTLDTILDSVKLLKKRKGIDCFTLDAWNRIEHKHDGKNETKYVNESLLKLDSFCKLHNLHCFLVAHPVKMEKDKRTGKFLVPNLYSISGSSHFFNVAGNGFTAYRNFDSGTTDIHIQKVKFQPEWGHQGVVTYKYDFDSGRFNESERRDAEGKIDPTFKYTPDTKNWLLSNQVQVSMEIPEAKQEGIITNENLSEMPF